MELRLFEVGVNVIANCINFPENICFRGLFVLVQFDNMKIIGKNIIENCQMLDF